jgi:hypothetical protein
VTFSGLSLVMLGLTDFFLAVAVAAAAITIIVMVT